MRKKYVIEPEFQFRLLLKIIGVIGLSALVTLLLMWFVRFQSFRLLPGDASVLLHVDPGNLVTLKQVRPGQLRSAPGGIPYLRVDKKPVMYDAFDLYWMPILAMSIVNCILFLFFGLRLSHRLAGSLYRLKKSLFYFLTGEKVGPVKLRRGDFFTDLAGLLNSVFEKQSPEKRKDP